MSRSRENFLRNRQKIETRFRRLFNDNSKNKFVIMNPNKIAVGGSFTAVITSENRVVCWGNTRNRKYNAPADLENVVAICCGTSHCVALTAEGQVVCWGSNAEGQCDVPAGLENVVQIGCSYFYNAALTADGRVICWGNNERGQCNVPEDLPRITFIDLEGDFVAALTADKRVVCWGNNERGQCNVPVNVENVVAISCGIYHTAALTADGRVICWGSNLEGQCEVPAGLENVVSISCGDMHTAALTETSQAFCWGFCCDFDDDIIQVDGVAGICSGYDFTVAVLLDGTAVFCIEGGPANRINAPEKLENVVSISLKQRTSRGQHIAAIMSDGSVCCWSDGQTDRGQCNVPAGLVAWTPYVILM